MMRKKCIKGVALTFFLVCWIVYVPAYAADIGLTDLLSSKLGVTQNQAEGGAGAIFQLAKKNLSSESFSSVAKVVPGIDRMMSAAPKEDKGSGTLGGITSMLGSGSKELGGMAGLTSAFGKLGLSGDMVGKFVPIILDYVKGRGGEQVMNLLKGALL
jgi:hypothetical protein